MTQRGQKRGLLTQIEKPETEGRGGRGGGRGRACRPRGRDTGRARESEEKQTTEREGTKSGEIAEEGIANWATCQRLLHNHLPFQVMAAKKQNKKKMGYWWKQRDGSHKENVTRESQNKIKLQGQSQAGPEGFHNKHCRLLCLDN